MKVPVEGMRTQRQARARMRSRSRRLQGPPERWPSALLLDVLRPHNTATRSWTCTALLVTLLCAPGPADALQTSAVEADPAVVGANAFERHSFLFMGGLQRSGTTWLESLVASPMVSGLSFDNVDMAAYRSQQPWVLQNHSQEYFEMVVRSGGVEGKFVQDAYPYVYLVRDVGSQNHTLDSLHIDAGAVSPQTAQRLYAQWSLFWDTTKAVLLEKTPENLLLGPFLQAAFGPANTRFAFVMRHPLVWALAIEKWIFPEFAALRTVEERVAFWFDCMSRAVEHLPQLRDVVMLQLETVSAAPELQRSVAGHLLCSSDSDGRSAASPVLGDIGGESAEILSSSLAYVSCWLSGMEFKSSVRRCVSRKSFRDPAFRQNSEELAADNRWRLKQLARQREAQANQFGYTFKSFVALARKQTASVLSERVAPGLPSFMASQLGVTVGASTVRAALRPYLAVLPPKSEQHPSALTPALSGRSRPGVILVYHKMGFDRDKPTGMDLRMTQIVSSLVALNQVVHFVCHCDVHASQLTPFDDSNVLIYTGSMQEQFYKAAEAASPLQSVLIFFTTLTMSVHQRLLQGESDWHMEPSGLLPEEQVLSWVRSKPRLQACAVAVADDIHYLRAVEVMARHDSSKAKLASEWIRRRELGFHSSVDGTATVSLEDAETLKGALQRHAADRAQRASGCSTGCTCSMTWVPYVQPTRSESTVEPFSRRHEGMLYVGGMHGLAVIAIEWLLQKVQPLIGDAAGRGQSELLRGGKGHLLLAGPGWAQHAAESRVLNESVMAGHATILGTLSDMQLDQRLQDHKVFVAPVLNGTGIATKNVLAMAHGIPLVTTVVGLNGLGLPDHQQAILVADSPSGFARHILKVQTSEKMFNTTWRAAMQHTRTYLSADRQREQLCRIIGCNAQKVETARPSTKQVSALCNADGSQWPLHRASHSASSSATKNGTAIVLLGLAGTNLSQIASALRSPHACLVSEPLQSIMRAPAQAQVDHLQSILTEPSYCREAAQEGGRPEKSSPAAINGFAMELASVEQVPTSILASVSGLQQLAQLLSGDKVVFVRRCSTAACAVDRLMPRAVHCGSSGPCNNSASRTPKLPPVDVLREAEACAAQDAALRTLLDAVGAESMDFFQEARHAALPAGQVSQLRNFLGLPHAHPLTSLMKGKVSSADDWSTSVDNAMEVRTKLAVSMHGATLSECNGSHIVASPTRVEAPRLKAALETLAARTHRRRPLLVVGSHGVEGGAALLGKVIAEACREYFTPQLGWRCVARDGFDSCDHEADICFLKQSQMSAGRFAERGYRFVHALRSPLEVFTRSFQLAIPNATHSMNASVLLAAAEVHWKMLSGGQLHAMQDMAESHASDPHTFSIRIEDLLPDGHANTTLAQVFAFLLDTEAANATVQALVAITAKVLLAAGRTELQGESQRKHLTKLLVRKPAKCQHVNRVQQSLKYPALPCGDASKPGGHTSNESIIEDGRRHSKRRSRRRLMEVEDVPHSHMRRLAAAWL